MKCLPSVLALLSLSVSGLASDTAERLPGIYAIIQDPSLRDGEWISLDNGEDLTGWQPKVRGYKLGDNPENTFRIEDGAISVGYEGYENFDYRFGHLFHETPYSQYILSLDYRFTGSQVAGGPEWAFENSGAMLHSQDPSSMGLDQDFPISIEVQFLGGTGAEHRPTANLCTPGTHVDMGGETIEDHCIESTAATFAGDQWVHIDVVMLGDEHVEHFVNGQSVMIYSAPQVGGGMVSGYLETAKTDGKRLQGGYISLQSESHPVQFKNIRLLDLSRISAH